MALRLGDTAPNFQADTTEGPIDFHQWMGDSWAVLFSHPRDFTPVCTTEIGTVCKLKPEFERRGVKVIGLSLDPVRDHKAWAKDIAETQGVQLNFPLIGDVEHHVARLYDMIHPQAGDDMTVRSTLVIDAAKRIRLVVTYPTSTGRSFPELLRAIDSLKLTSEHAVATPANWKHGDDVIIVPTLSDEEARKRFPQGWRAVKPYIRMIADPVHKG
jgi:thioredoxin-dependent peroxiredoxin